MWTISVRIMAALLANIFEKMKQDKSVVVLVAAVPTCIGFTGDKRKEAGKQFIDVGIAEEHAVAMASGIAKTAANLYLQLTQAFSREHMTRYPRIFVSIIILQHCL